MSITAACFSFFVAVCLISVDVIAYPDGARGFPNVFGVNKGNGPNICNLQKMTGPCRARHTRYFYNRKTRMCQEFVYGGCRGNENNFMTMDECNQQCPGLTATKGVTMPPQSCTLKVDVLATCSVRSSLKDMTLCANVPVRGSNETDCLEAGCCWHPIFKMCHQMVGQTITSNRCEVFVQDNEGFVGVASFQSTGDYPNGWLGLVDFESPFPGGFCILKKYARRVGITSTKKLDNKMALVQSRTRLYAGQTHQFVFTGTYEGVSVHKGAC